MAISFGVPRLALAGKASFATPCVTPVNLRITAVYRPLEEQFSHTWMTLPTLTIFSRGGCPVPLP